MRETENFKTVYTAHPFLDQSTLLIAGILVTVIYLWIIVTYLARVNIVIKTIS